MDTERLGSKPKLFGGSRLNLYLMILVAVTSFFMMFVLNRATPFAADDFNYHFIYWDKCSPETAITSFSDIITSMKYHYSVVNGRILLHTIVEAFILIGKPVFNVVNPAVYVVFTFLIYKHCVGSSKEKNAPLFLSINIMLWLFLRSFGQTTLWLDGSVNYLWGSTIRLAALLPFRLWSDGEKGLKNSPLSAAAMLILSLLAGATNENTGAAFVGVSVLFIIFYRVKKIKIPVWSFFALAGSAAGFVFILASPANFVRTASWGDAGNPLFRRLVGIPYHYCLYLAVPFLIALTAVIILKNTATPDKERLFLLSAVYLSGSLGSAFSMVATPYFPERAWFGVTVYMIIAAGVPLSALKLSSPVAKKAVCAALSVCCIWCAASFALTAADAVNVKRQYDERESYIEKQKDTGNFDIVVPPIKPEKKRSPLYGLTDISDDPDSVSMGAKLAYYEINSLKRSE
ncbi:MAG: DUF6056 family protein [Clostridiales bacterium]|nr:DUF6056 family protein [Clostridiales bacterium]